MVKELNIGSARKAKRLMKRQFNKKIIDEYNERLKVIETQREIDLMFAGDSQTEPIITNFGFSEPISREKFRYTAFVKSENINWSKQKSLMRRLKLGFQKKFGCTVNLCDESVTFRGNLIYIINIEGKDKISVLKCRNSLPNELKNNLIMFKSNAEESTAIIDEKWHSSTPYNPINNNVTSTKAIKLSY